MGHHHHSHEGHHHSRPSSLKILMLAIILAFGFAIIEAIAGWLAHSLALLSDAGHMAADGLSLILAAVASWIASKPPNERYSYGLGRAEVIGAWISSLSIFLIAIFIMIEAILRLKNPHAVHGLTVMWVAASGIIINLAIAWILSRGERNLNLRAAIIHVIGDLMGSVAAFTAGFVIYFTHWNLIDPLLSLFICLLMGVISLRLLRETFHVLMERVPKHISLTAVGESMSSLHAVAAVHDLHIWTLASGKIMLSAHIEIEHMHDWPLLFNQLENHLKKKFNIEHITLQPEPSTQTLTYVCNHRKKH